MNSYSIATQQNGNSENSKIAGIYQRMLLGDKSALSNLQKVKNFTRNYISHEEIQASLNQTQKNPDIEHLNRKNNNQKHFLKNTTYDNIKPINEEQQQEFREDENQKEEKQKQTLRSFIKKKVNQLRNEKQIFKYQEQKQLHQIKNISRNIKLNTANQSKSYDLVRKKQIPFSKSPENTHLPIRQQVKQRINNSNIRENLKKVQSSDQYNTGKYLPPLKEKKKIPTENSQHANQLIDSKVSSRDPKTPINLANFVSEFQTKSNQSINRKSLQSKKQSPITKLNSSNLKVNEKVKQTKVDRSRSIKVSLPKMKRQREEFSLINERQKDSQLDVMKFHQQTTKFIENIKIKHKINFRNEKYLIQLQGVLNPEPILNIMKAKEHLIQRTQIQSQASQKKKKNFQVYEDKINKNYKDINLIEEIVNKKKSDLAQMKQKQSKNLLLKFWKNHDLFNSDFQVEQQNQNESNIDNTQELSESKLKEAYSTAMPSSRDKNWKWKVIKQYDTNRSFQEYAKSRSQFKQSKQKQNNLNQIDQNDQEQHTDNKVTVNSRLKKLLLQ